MFFTTANRVTGGVAGSPATHVAATVAPAAAPSFGAPQGARHRGRSQHHPAGHRGERYIPDHRGYTARDLQEIRLRPQDCHLRQKW